MRRLGRNQLMVSRIRIPVLLIADLSVDVKLPRTLNVVARLTPLETMSRGSFSDIAADIAIIEMEKVDRPEILRCGIILRDWGRTGIVCDSSKLPMKMVRDLHKFITEKKKKGEAIKAELFFVEGAIEDITQLKELKKLD
jgi:hypothetical protein